MLKKKNLKKKKKGKQHHKCGASHGATVRIRDRIVAGMLCNQYKCQATLGRTVSFIAHSFHPISIDFMMFCPLREVL